MEDSVLKQVFQEELERLNRIEAVYREELLKLPMGSIVIKNIKGRQYPYLQYRSENQIKSKYIKISQLDEIKKGLERRKEIKKALKRVALDKMSLEKVLREKKRRYVE